MLLPLDFSKQYSVLKGGEKCIRKGKTVLEIVICGGKSSGLWSQISLYGCADVLL